MPTKSRVKLLASADRGTQRRDLGRTGTLLRFAAAHYRYTFLDMPRSDAAGLDALEAVTTIVLVANQELATVRNAGRIATALRQRYGKDRLRVVLTRFDKQAEIGQEDVERVDARGCAPCRSAAGGRAGPGERPACGADRGPQRRGARQQRGLRRADRGAGDETREHHVGPLRAGVRHGHRDGAADGHRRGRVADPAPADAARAQCQPLPHADHRAGDQATRRRDRIIERSDGLDRDWAVAPIFTNPNPGLSSVRIGELAMAILKRGGFTRRRRPLPPSAA